jgi:hypothetical protein
MTTTASLPAVPRDSRFVWATDLSTGRLHVANGSVCYCNRSFRVQPVAELPEVVAETCPACIALATSPPPAWMTVK